MRIWLQAEQNPQSRYLLIETSKGIHPLHPEIGDRKSTLLRIRTAFRLIVQIHIF